MDDNQVNQNNPDITVPPVQPVQPIQPILEPQPSPIQPQPVQTTPLPNQEHDTGTRTIVTVLVLLFAYPIGILLMWSWTKWPKWIKFLITLPIILAIVGLALAFFVATIDPTKQLGKAQDANYRNTAQEFSSAIQRYYKNNQTLPWTANPPCASKPTGNENIATLTPCVDLLIKDDQLKSGFLSNTTQVNNMLHALYVSDNSTSGNMNISTCFLPTVQTSTDIYAKDGQKCSSSTGCYACSFAEFAEIAPTTSPLITPTDVIQSSTPTPPASASGNTLLK